MSEIPLMVCRGKRRVRWLIVIRGASWVGIIGVISGIIGELVLHVGGVGSGAA